MERGRGVSARRAGPDADGGNRTVSRFGVSSVWWLGLSHGRVSRVWTKWRCAGVADSGGSGRESYAAGCRPWQWGRRRVQLAQIGGRSGATGRGGAVCLGRPRWVDVCWSGTGRTAGAMGAWCGVRRAGALGAAGRGPTCPGRPGGGCEADREPCCWRCGGVATRRRDEEHACEWMGAGGGEDGRHG